MSQIQEELSELKQSMVEMAGLVQWQIDKSIKALLKFDKLLAREVVFNEKRINAFELKIDKDCENIFALFGPVANDLRFVFSTLKSNSNFERIADNAEGIAHYVILAERPFNPQLVKDIKLVEMSEMMLSMMKDICTAYKDDNTDLAREMFERDIFLNDINRNATKVLTTYLQTVPDDIEESLYLLTIIRKMERVGDLVSNIAEEVIFYVEAKVLKHGKK